MEGKPAPKTSNKNSDKTQKEEDNANLTIQKTEKTDEICMVIEEEKNVRILPCYNCQEKIILVLDRGVDDLFTNFELNESSIIPLEMLKKSLELFLFLKHRINTKHEYALAVLNENSVSWCVDFTNKIDKIKDVLKALEPCEIEDIFELNSLFEQILEKVTIPEVEDIEQLRIPPPFTVRTILIYNRSYTLPTLERTDNINKLLDSPYFIFDALMTHEREDSDNNCSKIFQTLQDIDRKGRSYYFSVGRDTKKLQEDTCKLLGHPLQRPLQKDLNTKFFPKIKK